MGGSPFPLLCFMLFSRSRGLTRLEGKALAGLDVMGGWGDVQRGSEF